MQRGIAAKDKAALLRLAKDANLVASKRKELLQMRDARIRAALFRRPDLTEAECGTYFADETRVTVLSKLNPGDARWKTDFVVEKAIELRSTSLAKLVLEFATVGPAQADQILDIFFECGDPPPRIEAKHWRAVHPILQELSVEKLVWLTRTDRSIALISALCETGPPGQICNFVEALLKESDLTRVAEVARCLLHPVTLVNDIAEGSLSRAAPVVNLLSRAELSPSDVEAKSLLSAIDDFIELTQETDSLELIPVEPILERLDTASRVELSRVLCDADVILEAQQTISLACNPNHDELTADALVQRVKESPDFLNYWFGVISSLNAAVFRELAHRSWVRVEFRDVIQVTEASAIVAALEHERIESRSFFASRTFLGSAPSMQWLAPDGWTEDAEEVALQLTTRHFDSALSLSDELLTRHLGSGTELHVMFRKMERTWQGTIGELMGLVKSI